jgi:hypothetical protein
MSWRSAVRAALWLAALVALVVTAPVVLLAFDEAAVPPVSTAPDLPAGVTAADGDVYCGSGGCYRSFTLTGPDGQTPEELAASTGLTEEQCPVRNLLDRRRVCGYVSVVGDEVRLSLYYGRYWT